ncbi:EEF1A lysine methyltransferase 3-like [Acipenser oxyrinchus oxyrinchus]|uniref:EEF1A lysine methyltransferase 3-like n=1 Tax=Acipenser oxyrinchus oxyrinchus TaxID=40147 RepID=A0AAD8FT42_ACIOX|nr:EEF1A lysine methyltransferase 3-like [Acipenser oxyrinchus oxyrinchus]
MSFDFEPEESDLFRIEDALFADTFTRENRYRFSGQELKITQTFSSNLGVAGPVWEAAVSLCQYFEEKKFDFTGKRVLELGAGTGIVGILVALLGGDVTITDLPTALKQIQLNVSSNMPAGCRNFPRVRALAWGKDHHDFPSDYDLVLGADIVYLQDTYPALLRTLDHLCGEGTTVYLSSKMRREHGAVVFYEEQLPRYLEAELVHRNDCENISIFRGTKKTHAPFREAKER